MIKVAIIGAGYMGRTHLERYQNNADCVVKYIFDAQIDRAEKFLGLGAEHATSNLQEILNSDIDAVDICLPTHLHKEYCVKAAAAKKHVLCEKPMALDINECEEMICKCKENNVKLMVGHVIRFWPEYVCVQQAVEDNRYGKLLYIRSGRRQALPAWTFGNWMIDPKLSLGGVVDLQIHDLDYVIGLLGMPKKLKSIGVKSPQGGWEQITTVMEHNGETASCTEACNLMMDGYPFTSVFCAVFEKASIDFNCNAVQTLKIYTKDKKVFSPKLVQQDGYQNEIDYFVSCIKNDKSIVIGSGEGGLVALRLALLTKQSLDSGEEISI